MCSVCEAWAYRSNALRWPSVSDMYASCFFCQWLSIFVLYCYTQTGFGTRKHDLLAFGRNFLSRVYCVPLWLRTVMSHHHTCTSLCTNMLFARFLSVITERSANGWAPSFSTTTHVRTHTHTHTHTHTNPKHKYLPLHQNVHLADFL